MPSRCASSSPRSPSPRAPSLHAAQRAVDQRLIDACTALTEAQLEQPVAVPRSTGVKHETATRLLAHLFQHQIHHRGQAHAMLAGTDGQAAAARRILLRERSAQLRAPELAELGYAEARDLGACGTRVDRGLHSLDLLHHALGLPSLPLAAARCLRAGEGTQDDAAHPFVVSSGGHYPRVVAANAAARAAGIRADQLISAALALAPDLALRDRDGDAEARALAQLATWALTFTPRACLAPPDAVVADIGGSLRLFDGLPRIIARLIAARRRWVTPCGSASHPRPVPRCSSRARAARSPSTILAHLPELLAPLPLTLLDLDDALRTTLRDAGVTTFGQAAALPRDGLARRCGDELVRIIDRALGRTADPRAPFVPPPRFRGPPRPAGARARRRSARLRRAAARARTRDVAHRARARRGAPAA